MPCSAPITISGKWGNHAVACKQCLPCRINRQSGLCLQALFEQRTSLCADFWTLTYKDAPETLDYEDCSLFLKRLRIWNQRQGNPAPIRYLAVGEYGSKSGRAHFHLIVYNSLPLPPANSPDRKTLVTKLWPHGFVYIGTVTPASIRYTARYCLKFGEKGREGLAHWSKRPTLGADGMRWLANYMKRRGDQIDEPPTCLTIEGNKYFVNDAMRRIFMSTIEGDDYEPPRSSLKAAAEHLLNMRYGDPEAALKAKRRAMIEFYQTAYFSNEKI